MLEYFSYKKFKQSKLDKALEQEQEQKKKDEQAQIVKAEDDKDVTTEATTTGEQPATEDASQPNEEEVMGLASKLPTDKTVLDPDDEAFLENLLASDLGPAPPLPPRPEFSDESDVASIASDLKKDEKGKQKEQTKLNRFSSFFTRKKASDGLEPEGTVSPNEAEKEKKDLGRVLDKLNLSARNNKAVAESGSPDSSQVLQNFTQVFKDLVNGVPTAYDDLTKLIEDRDGTISKMFDKLPSSMKKLVMQLPDKLTKNLAPEILLAAAEAQGLTTAAAKEGGEMGMKAAAKKVFMPQNIMELVTKPGALAGMLRAIVEVLKDRWPAFIGMNVLWSVALSLLLLMLWYCYKRGREVRLEQEKSDAESAAGIKDDERIEELGESSGTPAEASTTQTPAGESSADKSPASETPANEEQAVQTPAEVNKDGLPTDLPKPPIGDDAPGESSKS